MHAGLGAVGLTVAVLVGAMVTPAPVAAHCDSMDGPVVAAARRALETGEVAAVLAWVRAEDEAEIRSALERTREARRGGGVAAELADRWFFETVVRVHRLGEGAPYTGLRPAGGPVDPGIAAAERALADGTAEVLAPRLAEHLTEAVLQRFEAVRARADHDPGDVEAGREYVEAYVAWIHFVEAIVAVVHGHEAHGAEGGG